MYQLFCELLREDNIFDKCNNIICFKNVNKLKKKLVIHHIRNYFSKLNDQNSIFSL